jgi:hypothetical protein
MVIILFLITLVLLSIFGKYERSPYLLSHSNYTHNIVDAHSAVNSSIVDFNLIFSQLTLVFYLLLSGAILLFLLIILLLAILLLLGTLGTYGAKLIYYVRYISIKASMMFHLESLQNWRNQEDKTTNSVSYFMQLIISKIDEEGRAYVSEAKLEWIRLGLTQNQIYIRTLRFIISHYCGRFVTWMRLPRFLFRR